MGVGVSLLGRRVELQSLSLSLLTGHLKKLFLTLFHTVCPSPLLTGRLNFFSVTDTLSLSLTHTHTHHSVGSKRGKYEVTKVILQYRLRMIPEIKSASVVVVERHPYLHTSQTDSPAR